MRFIYGPGDFDEELFRDLDLVLALAHRYRIRLILPFIDHWDWFGGINISPLSKTRSVWNSTRIRK